MWCLFNKQHSGKSEKCCINVKSMSGQSKFVFITGSVFFSAGTKPKILSTKDQVAKAEIFRCLDLNDPNCWFSVANRDSNKYKDIFPNSQIVNSNKQKASKVKYTLQCGIKPWFCNIILKELKKPLFVSIRWNYNLAN